MFLTSVAKVKSFLEKSETDFSLDTIIEDFIKAVSKKAETYCCREFEEKEYEEFHHGGTRHIFLLNPPIKEIIGIWVDVDYEWGTDTKIEETEFRLIGPDNGTIINREGYWSNYTDDKGIIKVIYVGGYNEGEIPEDLEMAIRLQVAYNVRRRKDLGLSSVSFPDGSIQKINNEEFLPEVVSVLDRYCLVRL